MKHLVQIQFTSQAAHNQSQTGGPAPAMGRLIERFAPESVYMSPARRMAFMVCDLEAADIAELMVAVSHISGQLPDFIPVVEGKEFAAIVAKAGPAGTALANG